MQCDILKKNANLNAVELFMVILIGTYGLESTGMGVKIY